MPITQTRPFDHYDDINRIEISLKLRLLASRFVAEHAIEGSPIYNVVSRVEETMVAKVTVYAAANAIELFVQTLIVLQPTHFLTEGS